MSRAVVLEVTDLGAGLSEPEAYPLPAYTKLTYTSRYWGGDSFFMAVDGNADDASALAKGKLLWLPDEANRIFLIDRVITDRSGPSRVDSKLTVVGRSFDTFMGKERVVVPSGDFDSQTAVPAETAMKHYVNVHAGPGASADRQIPALTIATDAGTGATVTVDARYKKLGDVLLHIGLRSGLGWATRVDPATGHLVFNILTGVDNSSTVLLDFDLKAIASWEDTDDMMEAPSIAFVGGQGVLAARDVVVRGAGPIGLDRREAFVDAVDVASGNTAALNARGDAFLQANAPTRRNRATLTQDGVFQPEEDFNLGDLIRIADDQQLSGPMTWALEGFSWFDPGSGARVQASMNNPGDGSKALKVRIRQGGPWPPGSISMAGPIVWESTDWGVVYNCSADSTAGDGSGVNTTPYAEPGTYSLIAGKTYVMTVEVTAGAGDLGYTTGLSSITSPDPRGWYPNLAWPSGLVVTPIPAPPQSGIAVGVEFAVGGFSVGFAAGGSLDETARVAGWEKTFAKSAAAPVIVVQIGKPFPATKYDKAGPGVAVKDLVLGMVNPMDGEDDLIIGGVAGVPVELEKGADSTVLTIDPITHHIAWDAPTGGGGTLDLEAPTGAPNGILATFTLVQGAPSAATAVMLFKNGILQKPGSGNDFTLAGAVVTFEAGNLPQTGDILLATLSGGGGGGGGGGMLQAQVLARQLGA